MQEIWKRLDIRLQDLPTTELYELSRMLHRSLADVYAVLDQRELIPQAALELLADTWMRDVHEDNGPGYVECPSCNARIMMKWKEGRRMDSPSDIFHSESCPIAWARRVLDSREGLHER